GFGIRRVDAPGARTRRRRRDERHGGHELQMVCAGVCAGDDEVDGRGLPLQPAGGRSGFMRRGIAQPLKRTMVAAFVAASVMLVGGCVQAPLISFGPATAMPSLIATNVTSPNAMEDNGVTVVRYDPS